MIGFRKENGEGGVQIIANRFHLGAVISGHTEEMKKQSMRLLKIAMMLSLLLIILLMQFSKRFSRPAKSFETTSALVTVEEIPPATEQAKASLAPSRPTIPIASEDETLPDDETIDLTALDLDAEPPPPPPPPSDDDDIFAFVPHDEPPRPIGGMEAILRNIEYPEIARRAGVEGSVLLYVQVDEKGEIVNTRVMRLEGIDVFKEAAIKAVKSVKWKPAMQRDRPVKVWASVPIDFVLKTE